MQLQESTCAHGAMLSTAAWTAIGALPTPAARKSSTKSASGKKWHWTRMQKIQSMIIALLSIFCASSYTCVILFQVDAGNSESFV